MTTISSMSPTRRPYIALVASWILSIRVPFTSTMMSPICSSASEAGLESTIRVMSSPLETLSPMEAAISGVSGRASSPVHTLLTLPYCLNSSITIFAMSAGIANPIPSVVPSSAENMKVLIPMTCPLLDTSGPPLLPGLIAASVWIMFLNIASLSELDLTSLFNALMTPTVTVGCVSLRR
jgi:hypothetical protein